MHEDIFLDSPFEAFNNSDIRFLLICNEGQYFERKRQREPKDIAKTLVAFANANDEKGGLFLAGAEDNGEIYGLIRAYGNNYENRIRNCSQYISNVTPQYFFIPTTNTQGDKDFLGLIYIPSSSQQVAEVANGDVYFRRGDQTLKLRTEEIIELRQSRGQDIPFGNLPSSTSLESAQLHQNLVDDYIEHTIASGIDLERILLNRRLAVQHQNVVKLTKSGLLLITQDPRHELPGAYVRFIKYEGVEASYGANQNVVQDETFFGPIPLLAQRVRDYVRTQIRQFRYLGDDNKFVVVPELPEQAWFEAIINALVHRSYRMVNDSISIRLFDDRLEIISPGTYPFGVNPLDFHLGRVSRPRNVVIMEFMRDIGYVQMYHEGTKRIFGAMQEAGLPEPVYSPAGESHVCVTLFNDVEKRRNAQSVESLYRPLSNLFRLEFQSIDDNNPDEKLSFQELRTGIINALQNNGYAVGSFTQDTAIDLQLRAKLTIPDFVSILDAFKFSLRQFNRNYYLAIDYKVEFRSRANLAVIMEKSPQLLTQSLNRGFARINENWKPCRIIQIFTQTQHALVELIDYEVENEKEKTEVELPFNRIVPDLNSTQLKELLSKIHSDINIHEERTKLSQIPPAIRIQKIRQINKELQDRVFPLPIAGNIAYLSLEPTEMALPDFHVSKELQDPPLSFDNNSHKDTIRGLTSFGAFQQLEEDIPIVLLSTKAQMPLLKGMATRLQIGSKLYRGFRETFGSGLRVHQTIEAESFDDYASICNRLSDELSRDPLPIVLMYTPDSGERWSRANLHSPYYQVKHNLLENGIPSQGVDLETLQNPEWKVLNLALDIYAKTGHIPWVLNEGLPLADIFIGLSYSSRKVGRNLERVIAYVCVFDKFGKWQYYLGNSEPVPFSERDTRLSGLIAEAVRQYSKRAIVQHIHIHHSHKLKNETKSKIADAVREIAPDSSVYMVYIDNYSPLRLFDAKGNGQVERGTFLQVSQSNTFFIATTGKTDLQSNYRGTPLITKGKVTVFGRNNIQDMTIFGQHILSLTRLNWASTRSFSASPITLLYSSKVAKLMNIFLQGYGGFKLHKDLERTPWFL